MPEPPHRKRSSEAQATRPRATARAARTAAAAAPGKPTGPAPPYADFFSSLLAVTVEGAALGEDQGRTGCYRAYGDRCLLSFGGATGRAVALRALVQAFEAGSLKTDLGAHFPRPVHGAPPVPPEPRIAVVTVGSALGSSYEGWKPSLRDGALGLAGTLHLEIEAPVTWLPSQLLQFLYLAGDGSLVFAPVSLQSTDAVVWIVGTALAGSRAIGEDEKARLWDFRVKYRNIFVLPRVLGASVAMSYPYIGWAIRRRPGELRAGHHLAVTLPVEVTLFDRFSVLAQGSALFHHGSSEPGMLVAVGVGIEL